MDELSYIINVEYGAVRKTGDRWVLRKIPKQTRGLIEKLGIEIPIP